MAPGGAGPLAGLGVGVSLGLCLCLLASGALAGWHQEAAPGALREPRASEYEAAVLDSLRAVREGRAPDPALRKMDGAPGSLADALLPDAQGQAEGREARLRLLRERRGLDWRMGADIPFSTGPTLSALNSSFYRYSSVNTPSDVSWASTIYMTPVQFQADVSAEAHLGRGWGLQEKAPGWQGLGSLGTSLVPSPGATELFRSLPVPSRASVGCFWAGSCAHAVLVVLGHGGCGHHQHCVGHRFAESWGGGRGAAAVRLRGHLVLPGRVARGRLCLVPGAGERAHPGCVPLLWPGRAHLQPHRPLPQGWRSMLPLHPLAPHLHARPAGHPPESLPAPATAL